MAKTKRRDSRPDWSKEPFYRFLGYLENEERLVHLAANGIRLVVHQETVAEALHGVADLMDWEEGESEKRLQAAKTEAAFAKEEVDTDFRLLHAHSVMAVWGCLENLVSDVVRTWLVRRPALLRADNLSGVKVSVAEFHVMSRAERVDYLLDRVPASQGVAGGFPRMEEQLKLVSLDGAVDDSLRRQLIEAYQVRNLYAHCGGFIDAKAMRTCPWRSPVCQADVRHLP